MFRHGSNPIRTSPPNSVFGMFNKPRTSIVIDRILLVRLPRKWKCILFHKKWGTRQKTSPQAVDTKSHYATGMAFASMSTSGQAKEPNGGSWQWSNIALACHIDILPWTYCFIHRHCLLPKYFALSRPTMHLYLENRPHPHHDHSQLTQSIPSSWTRVLKCNSTIPKDWLHSYSMSKRTYLVGSTH